MSSFKNAPDIMGEALGRLPINPQARVGKVVKMSPEAPDRARRLLDKLKAMRLSGMAAALEEAMVGSPARLLPVVQQLEILVAREDATRTQGRLRARIRKAGLRVEATIEGVDYNHPRNLDRARVTELAACAWVTQGSNVIITGHIGAGKTYLASALTHAACVRGHRALYRRLPDLLRELAEARAKRGLEKYMEALRRIDLLSLDDWGLEMLDHQQGIDLLEVIEGRDGAKSTLVASCLPLNGWVRFTENHTIGEAILDRLVHNAHQINLQGDSLRKEYSPLRGGGSEQSG
ncbi:MAG: IS21-like element helper ATPase IstB [Proteobacteria bacterium]|nr:IS21-like element helper ATPase IstB [Pseudomonadota bacterium]MBU1451318.1 IS21-like element helper ATPase IstB [Pseudomonadota bacterium]MBU2470168.1 IS21-like element helper ATPase IstB [Pseudomonadota bacterium]MBU2518103.1 IS21-like element helper ATPase IstB [Pseudomonadota bacterium]